MSIFLRGLLVVVFSFSLTICKNVQKKTRPSIQEKSSYEDPIKELTLQSDMEILNIDLRSATLSAKDSKPTTFYYIAYQASPDIDFVKVSLCKEQSCQNFLINAPYHMITETGDYTVSMVPCVHIDKVGDSSKQCGLPEEFSFIIPDSDPLPKDILDYAKSFETFETESIKTTEQLRAALIHGTCSSLIPSLEDLLLPNKSIKELSDPSELALTENEPVKSTLLPLASDFQVTYKDIYNWSGISKDDPSPTFKEGELVPPGQSSKGLGGRFFAFVHKVMVEQSLTWNQDLSLVQSDDKGVHYTNYTQLMEWMIQSYTSYSEEEMAKRRAALDALHKKIITSEIIAATTLLLGGVAVFGILARRIYVRTDKYLKADFNSKQDLIKQDSNKIKNSIAILNDKNASRSDRSKAQKDLKKYEGFYDKESHVFKKTTYIDRTNRHFEDFKSNRRKDIKGKYVAGAIAGVVLVSLGSAAAAYAQGRRDNSQELVAPEECLNLESNITKLMSDKQKVTELAERIINQFKENP